MNIMPDVVDAQLRLQFLGRDVMLPSVMASDPAHDPNALPVEAVKKPHVLSIYNPAFRAIQKQPDLTKSSESTSDSGAAASVRGPGVARPW
jgi:hypothetical protein